MRRNHHTKLQAWCTWATQHSQLHHRNRLASGLWWHKPPQFWPCCRKLGSNRHSQQPCACRHCSKHTLPCRRPALHLLANRRFLMSFQCWLWGRRATYYRAGNHALLFPRALSPYWSHWCSSAHILPSIRYSSRILAQFYQFCITSKVLGSSCSA